MFGREYVLVSIKWSNRARMTTLLNEAIAGHDHPHAAASIACMTATGEHMHFLIEKWRDVGDTEQDPEGVDATPADRPARRPRARAKHDAGAATGVGAESIDLPLGTPSVEGA